MEKYEFIKPGPLLSPYIAHYWILNSESGGNNIHRVHPTGCIQQLFYFCDKVYSLGRKKWEPSSYIGGQTSTYDDLSFSGKMDILGVVFRPYGAKAFYSLPMNEFYNSAIDIHLLNINWLNDLEESLHNSPNWQERIRIIESYFIKALTGQTTFNIKRLQPSILFASGAIEPDVNHMATISCLSTKQYKRLFAEYVGMNPKEFLRVVRFQRVLYSLQEYPELTFQSIAFDCGYYDLPHLNREFKSFTGYNPSDYKKLFSPYSDYFTA